MVETFSIDLLFSSSVRCVVRVLLLMWSSIVAVVVVVVGPQLPPGRTLSDSFRFIIDDMYTTRPCVLNICSSGAQLVIYAPACIMCSTLCQSSDYHNYYYYLY